MPDQVVKIVGSIDRTTLKPAKLSEDGEVKQEERIEILFHIPMTDLLRTKLADLSGLMNDSVVIDIASHQGKLL